MADVIDKAIENFLALNKVKKDESASLDLETPPTPKPTQGNTIYFEYKPKYLSVPFTWTPQYVTISSGAVLGSVLATGSDSTTVKDMSTYKTQKVKGLQALLKLHSDYPYEIPFVTPISKVIDVSQVDTEAEYTAYVSYPKFARPCPLTPRHGFVDSRVVKNNKELLKVIKETKEADPDGEVLLTDYISSEFNIVWTPVLLTVGSGHDGATAGKDCVSFPLTGKIDDYIKGALKPAGVKSFPYIEGVIAQPNFMYSQVLTQLRDGPVLDTKPNFIPTQVKVTEVITPNTSDGDLVAWEKLMLEKKGQSGVVVYHPTGSMSDHFAIHARSCQIPCVVTFKPAVGDVLEPVVTVPPDFEAVIRGLVAGSKVPIGKKQGSWGPYSGEAMFMLLGLHQSSAFEGEQAWWLGAAIAMMLRLGSMALRGEARHLKGSGKGSRSGVYEKASVMTMQTHAMKCNALINIFRYGWQHNAKGIGGRAWAQCGLALGQMFNTVRNFAKNQNAETYGAMLRAFNTAVNQAHNGGWWMNKFIQKDSFDKAQNGRIKPLFDAVPFLWRLNKFYKDEVTNESVARAKTRWSSWKQVDLSPARVVKAEVEYVLGSGWVTFHIIDRIIKGAHVPITLNLKQVLNKVPAKWDKEFYVREAANGLAIDIAFPGKIDTPITIWEEKPFQVQGHKE